MFVGTFDASGFTHVAIAECEVPPLRELSSRQAKPHRFKTSDGNEFESATFLHLKGGRMFCLLAHVDSEQFQWYSMTPTRETLAKIAVTGAGAEAAKL